MKKHIKSWLNKYWIPPKCIQILAGGYHLVHNNDMNQLYGLAHAAHDMLDVINTDNMYLKDIVQKDRVMSLLRENIKLIHKIIK